MLLTMKKIPKFLHILVLNPLRIIQLNILHLLLQL